jgi:hypothetical protein
MWWSHKIRISAIISLSCFPPQVFWIALFSHIQIVQGGKGSPDVSMAGVTA